MSYMSARFIIAVPVLAALAMLSPAAARAPTAGCAPSSLDYVILASLADSTNLLALSMDSRSH